MDFSAGHLHEEYERMKMQNNQDDAEEMNRQRSLINGNTKVDFGSISDPK